MKRESTKISVRIPTELHYRLKLGSAVFERSLNEQVMLYIQQGLFADTQKVQQVTEMLLSLDE